MACFYKWNVARFTAVKRGLRCLLAGGVFLVFTGQTLFAQVSGGGALPSSVTDSLFSVADSTYRRVIRDGSRSMSCYLNYPQGVAKVLEDFGGNAGELRKLDSFLEQVFRDSLIYVDSVRLWGYCSIEGAWDPNERLARNRAFGFRTYLDGKYALSSRYHVRVGWVAEDWDKLAEMVAASNMASRDAVLALIRDVDIFKGREKKLMELEGGDPYRYMAKEFFPALRRVEITVKYDLRRIIEEKVQRKLSEEEFQRELERERAAAEAEERRLAEEAERIAAEEAARIAAERAAAEAARLEAERAAAEAARLEAERRAAEAARLEAERRAAAEAARQQRREERKLHPLIGVKTDLVAWSGFCTDFELRAFMPNLEAEVYFAGRWSVAASALYADWKYGGGKHFWGISSYSGEGRFWVRNDGLFRGFFVGLYGMAGDFDLQRDRRDETVTTDNRTGTYWSAGIAAGYLLPLSRHWNLELALRGGYRSADYDFYDRELPHYYYRASDKESGFALTGLKLNIVYRFGRGK